MEAKKELTNSVILDLIYGAFVGKFAEDDDVYYQPEYVQHVLRNPYLNNYGKVKALCPHIEDDKGCVNLEAAEENINKYEERISMQVKTSATLDLKTKMEALDKSVQLYATVLDIYREAIGLLHSFCYATPD